MESPRSDRELAGRCQRGDVVAYQELVRRYRATLFRLACAILRDRDDAEDVVQEAFARAYRSINRYDSGREFAGWIRRITVNCSASKLEERRRGLARASSSASGDDPSPAPDPDHHLITDELQSHVRQAMDQLPLRQRVAISLFSLEDMDLAETATAMGHLLPILGRLNLSSANFGPTVTVREIRTHCPNAVIDGQLAPFTFSRNEEEGIVREFLRDFAMAREQRGLRFATAGSINNGSRLTVMRLIMAAIQHFGRYDA